LFVAVSLVVTVAGLSSACTIESAFLSGKFTENGFQVVSALDSKGNAIEKLSGKTFAKVETAENVVLPASRVDQLLYLVADADLDHGVLRVVSATANAGTADAALASAKAASSGKGCCAAKGAAAQSASASPASGGSSCSSVKAASVSNASGCGSAVKAAGAGAGCTYSKEASAAVAGAKGVCSAECAKACCAGADGVSTAILFRVTGMTCGGCASKIQAAVAALEIEGVEAVEVNVENGTAVVRCRGKVCTTTLKSAITDAGFPAEIAEAKAPAPAEVKS
jgi:copper chaperone CopZ